jgi:hypothetical protein
MSLEHLLFSYIVLKVVAREARMGSMKKDVFSDAVDSILFKNLILPSTPGYTGLLRLKYSFTMSVSVISKN